jgi:hypothetical protein
MARRPPLEIRWSTRDPGTLAARLGLFGLAVAADGRISFPSATIRLTSDPGRDDRLHVSDEPRQALPGDPRPSDGADVLAVGWATVDRDRVVAAAGAVGPAAAQALAADPHLGAFVVRVGLTVPARLVIEPDREGRLAATLARLGEGPVAIYLSTGPGGLAAFVAGVRVRGAEVSATRPGPLGSSVVLLGGPIWGPHLVVVEAAAPA